MMSYSCRVLSRMCLQISEMADRCSIRVQSDVSPFTPCKSPKTQNELKAHLDETRRYERLPARLELEVPGLDHCASSEKQRNGQ